MNTGTMNSLNTMIRTNDTGQAQLTRFIESPEIKMFIHDLRHLVQAIVGSADTLQMALQEHAADLAAKSLDRLRQNTDLAVDMLGHFGANPQVDDEQSTECDVAWEIERVVDMVLTRTSLLISLTKVIRRKHVEATKALALLSSSSSWKHTMGLCVYSRVRAEALGSWSGFQYPKR